MEYHGKLYGKIGDKYFDTSKTSDDYDSLEAKNKAQLEEIERLKADEKYWEDSFFKEQERADKHTNERNKLQSELKAAESVNEQKDKEIVKLTFMIEHGLGFEDLKNDIDKYPH